MNFRNRDEKLTELTKTVPLLFAQAFQSFYDSAFIEAKKGFVVTYDSAFKGAKEAFVTVYERTSIAPLLEEVKKERM